MAPVSARGAHDDSRALNFLVIQTDDQGPWALGSRTPEVLTPNLDALARISAEFPNFYCASPVCSPARASVITGRMPSAHGIHDWLAGDLGPESDHYLDGQVTTPEILSDHGWNCGMVGKWHLGPSKEPAPGFDFWYAHQRGGGPYTGAPIWVDGEPATEPRYFTDAVTDEAIAFLDASDRTRPFYLQVNYTAPHTPWFDQHPREYTALYDGATFPSIPREGPHPWFGDAQPEFVRAVADPAAALTGYCASISAVDAGVGRILRELDQGGARENTVVIFMSDNGFSTGHHGIWGKGNGTYPLNFWENSVRVPFLISLPGLIRPGTDMALRSACDLHPTLLDLAGLQLNEDPLRAGRSFAGRLLESGGSDDSDREAVMVFDEYGGGRMVRAGDMKYVERFDGPSELYDLNDDPEERHNLIGVSRRMASTASGLRGILVDWFRDHSRRETDAFEREVFGRGQRHSVWRDLPDDVTYQQPTGVWTEWQAKALPESRKP